MHGKTENVWFSQLNGDRLNTSLLLSVTMVTHFLENVGHAELLQISGLV
jgi:hypothetical protein